MPKTLKPGKASKPTTPSRNKSTGARPAKHPRHQPGRPCVVGIGASAGGLEAIKVFIGAMPPDSGLAFVIVQHLDPTHKSLAAEVISHWTAMRVVEASEGMRVEPDCVITIPAGKYLTLADGVLHLHKPQDLHGVRLPIDFFFHSLAEELREKAIGLILSGSGSDGALGTRSIAANGGIVVAQAPDSAQFDGMPRSAIATGLTSYTLPPEQIPPVLIAYARHPYAAGEAGLASAPLPEDKIGEILDIIRIRNDYSFNGYKKSTLVRRIQRRMGLWHVEELGGYRMLLKRDNQEVDALFRDLRIGMTEFFRDEPAWKLLEQEVIAPLVSGKMPDEPIRGWVPGVSTGEEAYSVAMLLLEAVKKAGKHCPVQVFATDSNEESLQYARAGMYPEGIAARVSAQRLANLFALDSNDHHYHVAQILRDMVVFAPQNLFTDPPFSRLDLISCRNLLIYLEPEAQQRLISLFDFALRIGGYLFLAARKRSAAMRARSDPSPRIGGFSSTSARPRSACSIFHSTRER